ncbi:kelch-like protein 12 isoform X2 [Lingula anatina]|uniref:Kelch-like protein 12 isoform X2 n=1 Tax=Lingula anatina TaxID=7574 RepID=A0A1S3JZ03_LINAN|nr:kelch-like protein 12 isoform X2 [Lingula anatina]|eukprot:XP_013415635.1 kelch-like protein 12 isoform X2 [Lingula anatina]
MAEGSSQASRDAKKLDELVSEITVLENLVEDLDIPREAFKHSFSLIDAELTRLNPSVQSSVNLHIPGVQVKKQSPQWKSGGVARLSATLYLPVKQYPNKNLIGRLIGRKGTTINRIQRETLCSITLKGHGVRKPFGSSQPQKPSFLSFPPDADCWTSMAQATDEEEKEEEDGTAETSVDSNTGGNDSSSSMFHFSEDVKQVSTKLYENWKKNILCDVTLVVEGLRISAHTIVLAAMSPYFEALFTSELYNKNEAEIDLHGLDAQAVKILVEYAYTRKLKIGAGNVESLLAAASFLQLHSLKEACALFMQNELGPHNCLGVLEFAKLHDCTSLYKAAEEILQSRCQEVLQEEEFLVHASVDRMRHLLETYSHQSCQVKPEILHAVVQWIESDMTDHIQYTQEFLTLAGIKAMTPKSLEAFYDDHPLLAATEVYQSLDTSLRDMHAQGLSTRDTSQSNEVINAVIQGEWFSNRKIYDIQPNLRIGSATFRNSPTFSSLFPDVQHKPLNSSRLLSTFTLHNDNIYFAGGTRDTDTYKNNWKGAFCKDPNSGRSLRILHAGGSDNITLEQPKVDAGAAVLNDRLYIVGGALPVSTCRSYGYHTKRVLYMPELVEAVDMNLGQVLSDVPALMTPRSCARAAALNGRLYVVGGSQLLVEENPDTTVQKGNMSHRRAVFAAPTVVTATAMSLNQAEAYDPREGKWTAVSSLDKPRRGHGLLMYDECLFAAGGYDDHRILNSVECYEPRMDRWMAVPSMNYERLGVALTTYNNLLCAVGGVPSVEYFSDRVGSCSPRKLGFPSLELYDPWTKTWTNLHCYDRFVETYITSAISAHKEMKLKTRKPVPPVKKSPGPFRNGRETIDIPHLDLSRGRFFSSRYSDESDFDYEDEYEYLMNMADLDYNSDDPYIF